MLEAITLTVTIDIVLSVRVRSPVHQPWATQITTHIWVCSAIGPTGATTLNIRPTQPKRLVLWWGLLVPFKLLCSSIVNYRCGTKPNIIIHLDYHFRPMSLLCEFLSLMTNKKKGDRSRLMQKNVSIRLVHGHMGYTTYDELATQYSMIELCAVSCRAQAQATQTGLVDPLHDEEETVRARHGAILST